MLIPVMPLNQFLILLTALIAGNASAIALGFGKKHVILLDEHVIEALIIVHAVKVLPQESQAAWVIRVRLEIVISTCISDTLGREFPAGMLRNDVEI